MKKSALAERVLCMIPFKEDNIEFIATHHHDNKHWLKKASELEQSVRYPIGDDWFSISHGTDYMAFFRRLGEAHHLTAVDGNAIAAMACGVLRKTNSGLIWYLGDLKVSPTYQNTGLPKRLMESGIDRWGELDDRVYSISMNKRDQSNPVVRLMGRLPKSPLKKLGILNIYQVRSSELELVTKTLGKHGLPVNGWLSLKGIKDIVLESTGKPMPLYHLQYGPCSVKGSNKIDVTGTYMFCAWADSNLATDLDALTLLDKSTATVMGNGLSKLDLDFILTSDI